MNPKMARWIATCGPFGYMSIAPGTTGSLIGILFVLHHQLLLSVILWVLMLGLAIWTSHLTSFELNQKDPQQVIIDEVCGIMTTFLFVFVYNWQRLLAGFIAFRLFDIFKPQPVRYMEKLPGGFGIVLDDVVAGIYANILLQLLIRYAHL